MWIPTWLRTLDRLFNLSGLLIQSACALWTRRRPETVSLGESRGDTVGTLGSVAAAMNHLTPT